MLCYDLSIRTYLDVCLRKDGCTDESQLDEGLAFRVAAFALCTTIAKGLSAREFLYNAGAEACVHNRFMWGRIHIEVEDKMQDTTTLMQ